MNKKFDVELKREIRVEFENPKAIEEYFIDGEEWKSYMYHLADLEELAGHIAFSFCVESTRYDDKKAEHYKFLEGFGEFYNTDSRLWVNKTNFGDILILNEEDLYVDNVWVKE